MEAAALVVVFGDRDVNIPVAALRYIAERAGSKGTRKVVGASHAISVGAPDQVTAAILDAIEAAEMRATAVGRYRRPGTRCGVRPLSTAGAYRDIGRVLLRCLDGIRDNDEAALRGAFARDATVTHTCPEQHMSFTAGVDELVRRVHRLHDEYACAAESPVRISIGVDGSAAVTRVEFVLLIGEAAFGGVGFYTLRAGPEGWEITRRLCLL